MNRAPNLTKRTNFQDKCSLWAPFMVFRQLYYFNDALLSWLMSSTSHGTDVRATPIILWSTCEVAQTPRKKEDFHHCDGKWESRGYPSYSSHISNVNKANALHVIWRQSKSIGRRMASLFFNLVIKLISNHQLLAGLRSN